MQPLVLALLLAARPFTPEELLATHRPDDIQVSPDGKHAAITVRQKSLEQNRDLKDIWLLALPGGEAKQFTRNGKSEHARWAPDGKSLLIGRERQLWLYPLEGGDPRQVTTLSTGADLESLSKKATLLAIADYQHGKRGAPFTVRRADFEAVMEEIGNLVNG